jgi:hypothetical protein
MDSQECHPPAADIHGKSCAKLPERVSSSGLGCGAMQHCIREVFDRSAVAVVIGRRMCDSFPPRLCIVDHYISGRVEGDFATITNDFAAPSKWQIISVRGGAQQLEYKWRRCLNNSVPQGLTMRSLERKT